MRNRKANGFTMVELLVVIAVIAMLVAVLLPAVNMAREAARNTQCKNRIGQLAKAAAMYHGRMNSFPGYRSNLSDVPVSWVVRLLPDIEEKALYEAWRTALAEGRFDATLTPFNSLLTCPSDPNVNESGPSLSYMANAGRAEDGEQFNSPEFGVFVDQTTPSSPVTTLDFIQQHGDGAGKTLLLAENIQLLFKNGQTGTRWDVPNPKMPDPNKTSNVFVWHCTNSPSQTMRISGDLNNPQLTPETARPASRHSGGVNVAFCDSRVTFLRDDISYAVYARLMAVHDEHAFVRPHRSDDPICTAIDASVPLSSSDYEL